MELAFMFALLIGMGPSGAPWGQKTISLSSDSDRILFSAYALPKASQFKVKTAYVMWIPRIEAFPKDPARQCLRLSACSVDGKVVEIVQVPSTSGNPRADVGRVISQGYLGNLLTTGSNMVVLKRGHTCIGLISAVLTTQEMNEIAETLTLIHRMSTKKKAVQKKTHQKEPSPTFR